MVDAARNTLPAPLPTQADVAWLGSHASRMQGLDTAIRTAIAQDMWGIPATTSAAAVYNTFKTNAGYDPMQYALGASPLSQDSARVLALQASVSAAIAQHAADQSKIAAAQSMAVRSAAPAGAAAPPTSSNSLWMGVAAVAALGAGAWWLTSRKKVRV